MFVAWLTAVTVRPGMAAPDASDTMPVTVARPVCAATGVVRVSPPSARKLSRRTTLEMVRIGSSSSLLAAAAARCRRPSAGLFEDVVVALLLQLRRQRPINLAGRVLSSAQHHQAPVVARLRHLSRLDDFLHFLRWNEPHAFAVGEYHVD